MRDRASQVDRKTHELQAKIDELQDQLRVSQAQPQGNPEPPPHDIEAVEKTAILEHRVTEYQTRIKTLETQLKDREHHDKNQREHLNDLQKKVRDEEIQTKHLQAQIETLRKHLRNEAADKETLTQNLHVRLRKIENLEREYDEVSGDLRNSKTRVNTLEASLVDITAKLRNIEHGAQVDQDSIQELQQQLIDSRKRALEAEDRYRDLEIELAIIRTELKEARAPNRSPRNPQPTYTPSVQQQTAVQPPNRHPSDNSGHSRQSLTSSRLNELGPTTRDLDKVARNIPRFEPTPGNTHNVQRYLKDIEFYLRRFPGVTMEDRMYVIKGTSNNEISTFLERQHASTLQHYDLFAQALIEEFGEPQLQTGLVTAMAVKQGKQESPVIYYQRLRNAYFGQTNERDMEEDFNFKSLFVRNLHPLTSQQLGVAACPRTLTSRALRDLAYKGFVKSKQIQTKSPDREVYSVISDMTSMELEGTKGGGMQNFRSKAPAPFPSC